MAAAAPIIAAIAAPTITGAITRIGLSLAVSFITSKLFAPDAPEAGSFEQAPDQGVLQRIATNTSNKLPVVYGRSKVFGSITFADITSDNQKMGFIISLCEGPVQSIGDIFWDNYRLTLDSNGDVTNAVDSDGNSNDFLTGNLKVVKFTSGGRCTPMEDFQGANDTARDASKWGNNRANRQMPGIAYLYVELNYDREKQVTGLTSKLGAIVTGRTIKPINGYDADDNITISKDDIVRYAFGDTEVNSNNPAECLADYLRNPRYGCGSIVNNDNLLDLETFWDHKQFCETSVDFTPTIFKPNFRYNTGALILQASVVYRANSDFTSGNTFSNSDWTAQGASVSSKRYTTNGTVNTNDSRDIVISDLTTNSQSIFAYQLGKYQMLSDTKSSFVETFNEDNTYGDVTIVNDGINSIKNIMSGSFISVDNRDKEQQLFEEITDNNVKGFNETELSQDIRFKFINNNIEARRALRVILNKSRDSLVVSFNTDTQAFKLQVGDVIRYSNKTYGFGFDADGNESTPKLFRINSISETQLNGDLSGYKLTCQEYNPIAYDGNIITADELAPNTNIPNPNNIGRVSNLAIKVGSPSLTERENSQITLTWTNPSDLSIVDTFQLFYSTSSTPSVNDRIFLDRAEILSGTYSPGGTSEYTFNNIPESVDEDGQRRYLWIRAINTRFGNSGEFNSNVVSLGDYSPIITAYDIYEAEEITAGRTPLTETQWISFGTTSFEVYAYTYGNTTGTGTDTVYSQPGIPVNGTATLINSMGELAAGPISDTALGTTENATYEVDLPTLDERIVYRTHARVTRGTVIGTWSTPSRFLLRGLTGPTGPSNITRYARFASDSEAATEGRPTADDGLKTGVWFSNPDLADGGYTHTSSQFATISTGASHSNYTLDLTGTTGATSAIRSRFSGIVDGTTTNVFDAGSVTPGQLTFDTNFEGTDNALPTLFDEPSAITSGSTSSPRYYIAARVFVATPRTGVTHISWRTGPGSNFGHSVGTNAFNSFWGTNWSNTGTFLSGFNDRNGTSITHGGVTLVNRGADLNNNIIYFTAEASTANGANHARNWLRGNGTTALSNFGIGSGATFNTDVRFDMYQAHRTFTLHKFRAVRFIRAGVGLGGSSSVNNNWLVLAGTNFTKGSNDLSVTSASVNGGIISKSNSFTQLQFKQLIGNLLTDVNPNTSASVSDTSEDIVLEFSIPNTPGNSAIYTFETKNRSEISNGGTFTPTEYTPATGTGQPSSFTLTFPDGTTTQEGLVNLPSGSTSAVVRDRAINAITAHPNWGAGAISGNIIVSSSVFGIQSGNFILTHDNDQTDNTSNNVTIVFSQTVVGTEAPQGDTITVVKTSAEVNYPAADPGPPVIEASTFILPSEVTGEELRNAFRTGLEDHGYYVTIDSVTNQLSFEDIGDGPSVLTLTRSIDGTNITTAGSDAPVASSLNISALTTGTPGVKQVANTESIRWSRPINTGIQVD